MNTQVCSATGDTPYNIVFRTNSRINWLTLQKLTQMGISNEDDIPDDVLVEDLSGPEEDA